MPYIRLETNKIIDDENALLQKLSAVAAQAIGKPESYVQTAVDSNRPMTFGGTGEPTAFILCKSIGLTSSQTKDISSALCEFCANELTIPEDRVYIEFTGAVGSMWGWKGGTFA